MDTILLIISLGPVALAIYLFADFLIWRSKGVVVLAAITGFSGKKNKGLPLPLVSFTKDDGTIVQGQAQRIDRFIHVLNRPGEGEGILIIYKQDDPKQIRVHGYMNIMAGLFLLVPFLFLLSIRYGSFLMSSQIAYFVVFGLIMVGGLTLLKLIQRNY